MIRELLEVSLLLVDLLAELEELLLLALADGIVLSGLLTAPEGITVKHRKRWVGFVSQSGRLIQIYGGKGQEVSRRRQNLPLATSLGGSAGIASSHDASGCREGAGGHSRADSLDDGCAEHFG